MSRVNDNKILDAIKKDPKSFGITITLEELTLEQKLINAIMLAPKEVVEKLLRQGANANAVHPKGGSLIEFAKNLDRQDVVELLRAHGAKEALEKGKPSKPLSRS